MIDKNKKKVRIPVTVRHDDEPEVTTDEVAPEEEVKLSPEVELEAIRQAADDYRDKYLRAAAELENTKKRLERRYADQAEEEKKRLLRSFLTVADNLERALAHSDHPASDHPASQGDSLRDGVKLTYQEIQRLLGQEGVDPLETIGKPFDPYYHEAVLTVACDDEVDTVVEERQKGYLYRGQLLRPAKVDVAVPASN